MKEIIKPESIEEKILLIRGQRVMLDRDLAELYSVQVKVLNQQVKRNKKRFPADFMFQLTWDETTGLRSQNVTLNLNLKSQFAISSSSDHAKYRPFAFTEQGVAMLSSVLNSDRAIQVNIEIMRTFTKLRAILAEHKDLLKKIEAMEKNYDRQFRIVFEYIRELTRPPEKAKRQIGFNPNEN